MVLVGISAMHKHVSDPIHSGQRQRFLIEFCIAQLVEKKDLPEKNVVLNQITQEMTYVLVVFSFT